jgi:hypothetical protein
VAVLATASGQVGVGMSTVPVRIIGRRLPGLVWAGRSNIHLGVQRGSEVVGIVRGDEGEATFDIEVELSDAGDDGVADFLGPYVHGRRGARFVYLCWGEVDDDGIFTTFQRLKLPLSPLVDQFGVEAVRNSQRVHVFLELTDPKGRPVAASVRPPWVFWRV